MIFLNSKAIKTFCWLAAIWVLVGVHRTYFNQMLQIARRLADPEPDRALAGE